MTITHTNSFSQCVNERFSFGFRMKKSRGCQQRRSMHVHTETPGSAASYTPKCGVLPIHAAAGGRLWETTAPLLLTPKIIRLALLHARETFSGIAQHPLAPF